MSGTAPFNPEDEADFGPYPGALQPGFGKVSSAGPFYGPGQGPAFGSAMQPQVRGLGRDPRDAEFDRGRSGSPLGMRRVDMDVPMNINERDDDNDSDNDSDRSETSETSEISETSESPQDIPRDRFNPDANRPVPVIPPTTSPTAPTPVAPVTIPPAKKLVPGPVQDVKKKESFLTPTIPNLGPFSGKSMARALNSILKFGTVFLVYRVGTYYFFESDKADAGPLFDSQTLVLAILLLVGFAIYYIFVDPFIPVNLKHPILNNIAHDSLMFGTVLLTSHVFELFISGGDFFDPAWWKSAGTILLAFASYRILVNPFIPLENVKQPAKSFVSDMAQYGVFMIALHLLKGSDFTSMGTYLSVLFALLGFAAYHLITKKLICFKGESK